MKTSSMMSPKIKSIGSGALAAAMVLSLVGCSPESPKATTPDIGKHENKTDSGQVAEFSQSVDILFVIDDSGSMAQHQSDLSRNAKLFIQEIQKTTLVDYHIGVVTTSMDNAQPYDPTAPFPSGCDYYSGSGGGGWSDGRACGDGKLVRYKTKVPFVDRNTPNGLSVLEQNMIVGTNGSSEEHSFDPIHAALTLPLENTVNAGFLRPDASLAIIIMTDAEDQSRQMDPQTLNNFLLQLKGGHQDRIMTYAAIVPSNVTNPSCTRDEDTVLPLRIEQFLKISNGTEYNICDPDYGTKLASIAKDVVDRVGGTMYLSRLPVVDTITVTYGSQVIPRDPDVGWEYDRHRNALIFGKHLVYSNQPPGTKVEVSFTVGIPKK